MSALYCRAQLACDGTALPRHAAVPACAACRRALGLPTSPSSHDRVRMLARNRAAYVAHVEAQGVEGARRTRLLRAWDEAFGGAA